MFKNRCCDRPMNYTSETSSKYTVNMDGAAYGYPEAMPAGMPMTGGMDCGCDMPPVRECPQERVVNCEYVHNVPHIVPINTRIINHHIYRHFYTPCYTSCEENVISNVYDNCPNRF